MTYTTIHTPNLKPQTPILYLIFSDKKLIMKRKKESGSSSSSKKLGDPKNIKRGRSQEVRQEVSQEVSQEVRQEVSQEVSVLEQIMADMERLNRRLGLKRKLGQDESKQIVSEVLDEQIDSGSYKQESRAEPGHIQIRRGRSTSAEVGGDLFIRDCVVQLDDLKRGSCRHWGSQRNTQS